MSRTHRLFDLLQMLRRHRRPVSGAALAEEAGVSLRTLYRDIAALQAMGAEIDGEPGVGYVLKPGFLLPPLMFSAEEIEALALGLKWVAQRTDEGMGAAARDAMAKLAAVLPPDLGQRMEDDALVIGPGWKRPKSVELSLLRQALNTERKLALSYVDEAGATSERVVWPVTLGFFETKRVLVAWCELRNAYRSFRADRMLAAEILADRSPRPRRQMMKEWRQTLLTKTVSETPYRGDTSTDVTRDREEVPMAKELIFYTNPQSRAYIVHWMLQEVGCPYTVKVLDFGTTMKAPEYLSVNPMGKVPAIVHGDQVVTEAAAICAYLADAFPEAGLLPAPEHRGAYYRWLFFTAACLEPAVSNHAEGWDPSPEKQRGFGYGSYAMVLDTLAGALKGRRYIAGDRFSAADVYLASHLQWGMMVGMIEKRPKFEAYCAPLVSRPAAERADAEVKKLEAQKAWSAA